MRIILIKGIKHEVSKSEAKLIKLLQATPSADTRAASIRVWIAEAPNDIAKTRRQAIGDEFK